MAEEPRRDPEPRSAPRPPARVTLPLLTLITQQSLDEDYVLAAERRVLSGNPPPRRRPQLIAVAVITVFGILVTTAAVQTSRNADIDDASHNTLVARIENQRDQLSSLQEQAASVRAENNELEEELTAVSADLQSSTAALRRLQARTGFVQVVGPGVRLVANDSQSAVERIRKDDLFLLINALWAAGAEAITLNGRRLSVLTSINNSGGAINVDLSPIRAPYTLQAIGDPRTLQANVVESSTFDQFTVLMSQYGFTLEMEDVESMTLPAAPAKRLVAADGAGSTERPNRKDEENSS
ncbi:DUF881 domain-containing protein [Nocardioides sp. dk4132]|uniref:DUF881 domain-containing protein n=1 Tax=unclassified Nocardioides TaxID=2615069 RepID=UPI0012973F23|nr:MULTISPECIES: DUF881 domain-containing protein [unclassified Nocardioides]MQW75239.1 DUF881 domain-containing protein [Nocardioides sp. dk4132]QGA07608.1 DUF881 domain-containing protein [Nocardioides sp. dk884]